MTVRRAVILAAGRGLRLRGTIDDRPKGLIELDGEALVARSARLLRCAGVARVTLVIGYMAEQYRAFARTRPDIDLVDNPDYDTTGSMASLAAALDRLDEDVLVLESDIVYEARALDAIGVAGGCATLVSGVTGAGDEVWVHAPGGRLSAMSKQRDRLPDIAGEFVGITRLTREAVAGMRDVYRAFVAEHGHARIDYETDALVSVAREIPVSAVYAPDLVWGEIDDEAQYQRILSVVWPAIASRSLG